MDQSDVAKLEFAERIIEKLRSVGDDRRAQFNVDKFQIEFFDEDGNGKGVLNLANLFAEFNQLEPEQQDAKISEVTRAALSHLKPLPSNFEEAKYDLKPRIWARSTIELVNLRSRLEGSSPPNWPLQSVGSHLFLTLVYDLPESVRSLGATELDDWGIRFWQAREVAVENLREDDFALASLGDILYVTNSGDTYDATRIVLTHFLEELKLDGDPVAMAPNRDTLMITGSNSEKGVSMMIELMATELNEHPRPLSIEPLIWKNGEWEDWTIPKTNPKYEEYRRCQLGWLDLTYGQQKQLLDEIYEKELIEEFVASFTVVSKEEQLASYSVWSEGVITSLPKTDFIAFARTGGVVAFVPWDLAMEHCQELIEEQAYYPTRFKVTSFPDEATLSKLTSDLD